MISVVIATYNRPHYLRCALEGLRRQRDAPPFEVVIADDGSTVETAALLDAYRNLLSVPLIHARHEDRGFRLAEVRNLAVSHAHGDFLIFLDDDCVPLASFVARYARMLRPGRLVFGERVMLAESITARIVEGQTSLHEWSMLDWWRHYRAGQVDRFSRLVALPLGGLRYLLRNAWTAAEGCNIGVSRADFLRVNGFDSDFVGWGCEDWDFSARLWHAGTGMYDGRFALAVAHLWHTESPRGRLSANQSRLDLTVRTKRIRAERGFAEISVPA